MPTFRPCARTAATALLVAALAACVRQPPASPPADVQPEAATGCRADVEAVFGTGGLVVAAHPEAARIGADILARGGSAADAAVAVSVALTLVEPQSSGIGGGGFALYHDAATGSLRAYDGRETAPAVATPAWFLEGGTPRNWTEVVPTGLSVGVPGLVRMLGLLHEAGGRLPWADLMEPTIALAEEGFTVTPRLSRLVASVEESTDALRRHPASRAYFYPDGSPLRPGHRLRNPELARTLRVLAEGGPDAFYEGPIARAVVDAVGATDPPGGITLGDLAAYRAVVREPVCTTYRDHRVCGHPPPSSGGVAVLQIVEMLERFDLGAVEPTSPTFAHLFSEASRLAFADRGRYLADPDVVAVPTARLLDEAYLMQRAARIDPDVALAEVEAGEIARPPDPPGPICPEPRDTTHFVVVDADGNVASVTNSIENAFGSGILVGGFLLNNQLTDFDFDPVGEGGALRANAVAACKRPRSSMAPTVVYGFDGQVHLALGSPGGSRIIPYVARVLVQAVDQGLGVQEAIAHPNLVATGRVVELEEDCGTPPWPAATVEALRARGHEVRLGSLNSGLHAIERVPGGWRSGVDPRRDGHAIAVEAPGAGGP